MNIHDCYVAKENNTQEEILNTLKQQVSALEIDVNQLNLVGYSYKGGHDSKVNGDFINEVYKLIKQYKEVKIIYFRNFTFTESIKAFKGVLSELHITACTLSTEESKENTVNLNASESSIDKIGFSYVLNLGNSFKSLAPFANKGTHIITIHDTFLNSFEGLELFPSIVNLYLRDNRIASFNELPVLENLETVDVSNNNIKDFKNLKVMPKLRVLQACCNKIYSLRDLPTMPELKQLHVFNNKLKSLTGLKKQPKLEVLDASTNKILKVPASKSFETLSYLYLGNNLISDIDLSLCNSLMELSIYSNKLTSLDLKGIPSIDTLTCSDNHIQKIFNSNTSGVVTKVGCLTAERNSIYDIKDISVEVTHSLYLNRNPIKNLDCLETQPLITSLELDNCHYLRSLVGKSTATSNIEILNISNAVRKRIDSEITNEDFFIHYANLVKLFVKNSYIIRNLSNIGKLQNLLYLTLINTPIVSFPLEIIKCKDLKEITFTTPHNFSLDNKELNNLLEILALHRIINYDINTGEFLIRLDISSISFKDILRLLDTNIYELLIKKNAIEILSLSESMTDTFKTLKVKDVVEIRAGSDFVIFHPVTK